MKADIENYRGWSISFDTEKETFYCHSDNYDKDENKKSYASIKKFIDEFLKENEAFIPVWIESKPTSYVTHKKIKLIGIRKDGRFIYEDAKGEKRQLADYQEKDYILYNQENDSYREEAEKINIQIDELREKRTKILDKVKGVELTEYKKTITNKS